MINADPSTNLSDYTIPILALLGTLFGGAGLEFVKRWLGKAKETNDIATNLRNELRGELTALKLEMEATEKESNEWRARYYEVLEKYLTVKIQYDNSVRLLRENSLTVPDEVIIPQKVVLTPPPADPTAPVDPPPTT